MTRARFRYIAALVAAISSCTPAVAQQETAPLNIVQTGPADFNGTTALTYNGIYITHRTDDTATDSRSFGLYVHSNVGGPSQVGAYYGVFSQLNHDQNSASGGDHTALVGQATSTSTDTSGGQLYGGNTVGVCSGCVAQGVNGLESDVEISNGGSSQERTAIRATNQADGTATGADNAYSITSTNLAGSFKTGMRLSTEFGAFPIQPSGDVIYSDPGTVQNFADLGNLKINGWIFYIPNFRVYWNGVTWLTATVTLPQRYVDLPACSQSWFGTTAVIADSATAAWGAIVSGGSGNHVLVFCDGMYWTVAGR